MNFLFLLISSAKAYPKTVIFQIVKLKLILNLDEVKESKKERKNTISVPVS